ncbi:MAG: hypothetical protein ACK4K5_06420 [Thermosynechococcus sp.]
MSLAAAQLQDPREETAARRDRWLSKLSFLPLGVIALGDRPRLR